MSKVTRVSSQGLKDKPMKDKTDWKKIFNQSQSQVDSEAYKDKDNPIIKNGKSRRLK